MQRLADFRKQVVEGWTVQRIAFVLIVVGLVVFVAGVVNQNCICAGWPSLGNILNRTIGDFYANVSVDCLSIAFAILVIDRLNERRTEREAQANLKAQLIREMGSTDNGIAVRAVNELRVHGWLEDGSLRGTVLMDANLRGANLRHADLQDAILLSANLQRAYLFDADLQGAWLAMAQLHGANLQSSNLQRANMVGAELSGADLRHANLEQADIAEEQLFTTELAHATMPDGSRYDGRYSREKAFVVYHRLNGQVVIDHVDPEKPESVAHYYGVSLEDYLAGKTWAREHLADLRRKAGLDPATGLPVEPTNGVEPQPATTPAPSAPRRNGHKASIVSHRVRR